MASTYYTSVGKEVIDGDVAYASDLNDINTTVDAGFQLVETAISTLGLDIDYYSVLAEKWANNPEDVAVTPGKYSALHFSEKAKDSEVIAIASAATATTKASDASSYANTATTQAGIATTQASTATTQAGIASSSSSSASGSASTATTQAGIATTQAGIATTQAGTSTTQASTATTQAGIATSAANAVARFDTLLEIGNAGTSLTLATGTYDTFTFTCDQATLNLSSTSLTLGRTVTLVITGADNCTITWPSGVKTPAGAPLLFTSGVDRVVLQRVSASSIHLGLAGQNYA